MTALSADITRIEASIYAASCNQTRWIALAVYGAVLLSTLLHYVFEPAPKTVPPQTVYVIPTYP